MLALQERQPPADPGARPILIGIEDGYGDLVHVVETTRLIEAVRVFELLSDYGLVPGHGRCRASDGRTLMRTYRRPGGRDLAPAAVAAAGMQRTGSTVPGGVTRP